MDIFHFILGPIRGVLVWFDSVIYERIPDLYKLMLYLANIDVVSNNVPVQALIQRIYILVGVFMLFKLSFSIMNYIVNPDAFSDQSKGFTNLIKRVMIAIVLLVSIPWIFKQFYVVQAQIIKSGILPRLVLGDSAANSDINSRKKKGSVNNNELENTIESSAKDVEFLLYGPFYSLNYKADDLKACTPEPGSPSKHIFGTKDMAGDEACLNAVATLMDGDSTIIASDVNIRDFFRNTKDGGVDQRNFSQFGDLASWTLSNGQFAINYNPIISTLCGGYLVFLLLSFCIDMAGRIFRLLFLQILSPIAVISSVDPTSSTDRLKEWATECLKVWISLFLRMLIIFLIIQLVRVITNTIYSDSFKIEGYSNSNGIPVWIYIFLIIGIFNAAGKIPELIEKATGLKLSGELQLNPFKNPWVAGATGLGIAGAGMLGANIYAAGKRIGGFVGDLSNSFIGSEKASIEEASNRFWMQQKKKELDNAIWAQQDAYRTYGAGSKQHVEAMNRRWAAESALRRQTRKWSTSAKDAAEAKQAFKTELSEVSKNKGYIAGQAASSIAGIFTGAAAGAARGAIGAYGKGLSGAISAADKARSQTTDRRNDRDSRADANHEAVVNAREKNQVPDKPYTFRNRVENALDTFADVKRSKDHGVGLYSERAKTAQMDLSNLQRQLSRTVEGLADARIKFDGAGISDDNIKKLMSQLDALIATGSPEERERWAKDVGSAVGSAGLTVEQRSIVESVANTVTRMDSLTAAVRDKEKEISKINDLANNNAKNNS
ncbi:MAG: hypothetical protein IKE75_01175 [Bacilli bacterium]|nr:hypothetical protein [Bacilli bacterium]